VKLKEIVRAAKCSGLVPALLLNTAIAVPAVAAVRPTFVHSFTGKPDGADPEGGLVKGADGALYGTTIYGGSYGYDPLDGSYGNGTIFRIGSDNSYSVLYSFTPLSSNPSPSSPLGNFDGRWPNMALVAAADGSLYGVTPYGGVNDGGSVFRYSTSGGFTALHYFGLLDNDPLGTRPQAPLTLGPGGVLFGTTDYGGSDDPNDGTVFRMNDDGSGFQVLQSFGFTSLAELPDSQLLAASDGFLYGIVSRYDGYAGGALYRVAPDGTGFTVLYQFDYATQGGFYGVGVLPPPIEGADGSLYGGLADGGAGDGAIYRMAKDGTGITILHAFAVQGGVAADGSVVHTPLIFGADGLLYGATQFGGINDKGTIFRLATDGSGYTVLYSFPALVHGRNRVGANPMGRVAFNSKGQLCGIAAAGGSKGLGTAWCLKVK
jgi:uncharacterized repeat protein (TIGR03803 family)